MTKEIEEKVKEGLAAALKIEESTNPGLAQGRSHYFPAGWFAGANFMYSLLTPPADVQERAKELAVDFAWENVLNHADGYQSFRKAFDTWFSGNKYHQDKHLAGASSVSGMQWVKASDGNFPTIRANYFLRHKYDDGRWHGWWMFVIPEIIDRQSWVRLGYEWLDESGASSLQAEAETFKDAYIERNEKANDLQAENERLKRILHDLTPGGSEFYNDPERCAKWIRESRDEAHYSMAGMIKKLKDENEQLKALNKQ